MSGPHIYLKGSIDALPLMFAVCDCSGHCEIPSEKVKLQNKDLTLLE